MIRTLLAFHLMVVSFLVFHNDPSKTVHTANVIRNFDLVFSFADHFANMKWFSCSVLFCNPMDPFLSLA